MLAGFCVLVTMMLGWFGTVVGESEERLYNRRVDLSFRWGMSWFIFSEVMFFAAFFGALFYVRNLSVPDLGGMESRSCGRTTRRRGQPTARISKDVFTPMKAIGIPLLNTIILVSSGGTLTVAHHALKVGNRGALKLWLFITIVLGFTFLGFQAYEYTPRLQRAQPQAVDGSLRLDVLHAYRVPRLSRDDRRDHADGHARCARSAGTSMRSIISRSRPLRGTGTSSTSSGCCCLSWSTGSSPRERRPSKSRGNRAAFLVDESFRLKCWGLQRRPASPIHPK